MSGVEKKIALVRLAKQRHIEALYDRISHLIKEYPNLPTWYFGKVLPEALDGTNHRKIYEAYCDGVFAGAMILKSSQEEKKICTLYVAPEYRGKGVGTCMINWANEYVYGQGVE